MVAWVLGISFGLGAIIGSFLNVVIYRLPLGNSVSFPKNSYCPNCKHKLNAFDLIPILSYMFGLGKCRYCKAYISQRYLRVEILNGLIWAFLSWLFLLETWDPGKAIHSAIFASVLICIFYIDLEHFIIPNSLSFLLLLIGLSYNALSFIQFRSEWIHDGWPSSLIGAWVGTFIIWLIAFIGRLAFKRDAMGHGDIKMARGIGAFLLMTGILKSVVLAIFFGAIVGIIQMFGKKPQTQENLDLKNESIGSLIKCGIGYLLFIDILGCFVPSLNKAWFGLEEKYSKSETITAVPIITSDMMAFGPFLALGALITLLLNSQLNQCIENYINWCAK